MRPRDIIAAAEAAGFSRATVYRARAELGEQIANTKSSRDPHNEWVLADNSETAADSLETGE
jgi:hypothetical protein